MAVLAIGFASAAMAQNSDDKPAITIKTSAYATNGESNVATILIGGTIEGTYIDVDCGYGLEKHEIKIAHNDGQAAGAGRY